MMNRHRMSRNDSPEFDMSAPFVTRRLTSADQLALDDLASRYPLRLLTPRLNVEQHGFVGPNLTCWGVFGAQTNVLNGLLLRLNNTVIAVDGMGECASAFAGIIDGEVGLLGIRGTVEAVRGIQAALTRYRTVDWEDSLFMRLQEPPVIAPELLRLARRAIPTDLDSLAALYHGAETMYRSRANVAAKIAESRVFVVEAGEANRRTGRIVSSALLNVEGRDAGLIGGVFTHVEARGRGYASACTAALCLDLQRDGKLPCLFFENPIAGRAYRRLGFEEVGQWAVLYLHAVRERV